LNSVVNVHAVVKHGCQTAENNMGWEFTYETNVFMLTFIEARFFYNYDEKYGLTYYR